MAKQEKQTPSWDDFDADNLLKGDTDEVEKDEDSEQEEVEKQEEEEEKKPVKKSKKVVAAPAKPAKEEEQEEEDEEEQEDEQEDEVVAKKKTTAESEDEEEESDEDDQPTAQEFFEQVEKLTGLELDVDYGDIDPLTPQGVALREKAVREAAVDSFLDELETNFPAAFKALQHAYNGGDVADLFKTSTVRDYSKVTLGDNDKDLAREILREFYQSKGVKNEAKLKRMLEADEESEAGLVSEAKSALTELQSEQAAKADEVLKAQKGKADEQKKNDQIMIAAVDEVLDSGRLGSFKLAGKQEIAEFKKFLGPNLKRAQDGKGYEFSTKIDASNLERLLQAQYFQFKKGDLSKLIQIKAASEQAKKFRLKAQAEGGKKKGSDFETAADKGKKPSLQDYYID